MQIGQSRLHPRLLQTSSDGDPSIGIAAAVLAVVTLFAVAHPHPLVLPLLSVILVVAGFIAAGWVWYRSRGAEGDRLARLSTPGVILFFGFAAAMLGDPDPAVQSLQQMK